MGDYFLIGIGEPVPLAFTARRATAINNRVGIMDYT
jgi:hypothetical protein